MCSYESKVQGHAAFRKMDHARLGSFTVKMAGSPED